MIQYLFRKTVETLPPNRNNSSIFFNVNAYFHKFINLYVLTTK